MPHHSNFAIEVAKQAGCSQADARKMISAVFAATRTQLQAGATVNIRRFGKFEVVNAAPRVTRDPRTGARIDIPARKRVKFRQSSELLGDAS